MKRLVLLTMFSIPISAQASSLTGMTQDSPCFNITVVSVMAMYARQTGEPLELLIKAYEDEPDLTLEIKKVVISILKYAYSVPIRATEKERDMEVTKFSNEAKASCLRDNELNSPKS